MSINGNRSAAKPKHKAKRAAKGKQPNLSALFLLGSDGEVYATCPLPTPPIRLARDAEFIMAIRLNRRERDILVDTVHTEGVIEGARGNPPASRVAPPRC